MKIPDANKWEVPSLPIILGNNDIHIWHVDIEKEIQNLEFYRNILSSDENEQANRFHFERDKMRHILTHGVLRLLINKYTGTEVNKIAFNYNKHSKPELSDIENKKLCFNLSHSGTHIVYAFSWNREIGIDIEKIHTVNNADGIIERFCSEHEKTEYFSFPSENRAEIFFTCWTRKEAYIKARGDGLYFPLDNFSVSLNPDDPPVLLDVKDEPLEKDRWHFYDLVINTDYCGCIAIEGAETKFRFFRWLKLK